MFLESIASGINLSSLLPSAVSVKFAVKILSGSTKYGSPVLFTNVIRTFLTVLLLLPPSYAVMSS